LLALGDIFASFCTFPLTVYLLKALVIVGLNLTEAIDFDFNFKNNFFTAKRVILTFR
jgi:hypothetical protein